MTKPDTKYCLAIVDADSWCYRSFHAAPKEYSKNGHPNTVISVFIKMLRKLERQIETRDIVVVFGGQGKSFRHELYPSYQADKPIMPTELSNQIVPLCLLLESLGYRTIRLTDQEPHDVIASIATQTDKNVLICSPSKDLFQLINDKITVYDNAANQFFGKDECLEKLGVLPEGVIDLYALTGKSNYSVTGIPGIGQVTAATLINQLGSLANVYSDLEAVEALDIRGAKSLKTKLESHRDDARMAYQLMRLKKDLDINIQLPNPEPNPAVSNWLVHSLGLSF